MSDYEGYSPRNRAERVIAIGRVLLAIFLLLAQLLDSTEPGLYGTLVGRLAIWYLAYSAGLALLMWNKRSTTQAVSVAVHVVDLAVFAVFMHFSEGPTSPFFVYFVFATICGTLRWETRGALLTGAAVIAGYTVITIADSAIGGRPFPTIRFITRCTHLGIVTGLLGYLGSYHHRLRREIESLAAWPRRLPLHEPHAIQEVLTYAARILEVAQVVLVWEEEDEPSLRIATIASGRFDLMRERPDAFDSLVADELRLSSFLCSDAHARSCEVLQRVPGGFRFWRGAPLNRTFRDRFQITSVIGLRLATGSIEGWLFAVGRPRPSADDILLGDIVGRLVTGVLELNALVAQLREGAAGEERLRLARELHDGVLQSLTAAALQARRARQAIAADPSEAERRLVKIEETILAEQQALRQAIADLNPAAARGAVVNDCAGRVRDTAERVANQWDIRVDLEIQPDIPPVPHRTAHEVTRMVQESLVNAVRHGAATEVRLALTADANELRLAISYEGRGFAGLQGRHDLASLKQMKAGPRTLQERVSALGGSVVIDSHAGGAAVMIAVPITSGR
jgi:signal transduction histidine kinase